MRIEIFNVEHGQCALVTADDGAHMLIDCGHNTTTGWRPSTMLAVRGINHLDTIAISNCDEDHISDLTNVARQLLTDDGTTVNVAWLNHNRSISPEVISAMKFPNTLSENMKIMCALIPKFTGGGGLGLRTFGPGTCDLYCNSYPQQFSDPTEQGFSNNMSVVTFLHFGDIHIVFPGDLEAKGWRLLLSHATFRADLARTNIFVASHHGRTTGYLSDVFKMCNPKVVIISDDMVQYQTQTGVYGPLQASGLMMSPRPSNNPFSGLGSGGGLGLGAFQADVNTRYVLTTRHDTSQQFPAIVIEQQPGQSAQITTSREWAIL